MKKITIKIVIEFHEIEEAIRTLENSAIIKLKNGDSITITGEHGNRISKQFCKNHTGDTYLTTTKNQ
jgi:DNA polymerase III sliding clamp (beta) subunit (PCNA family)